MKVLSVSKDVRWARQHLAVRYAAGAWVALAAVNFGLAVLPGTDRSHFGAIIALTAFALGWATVTMLVPATRHLQAMFQAGTVFAVLIVPLGIAASGGTQSP